MLLCIAFLILACKKDNSNDKIILSKKEYVKYKVILMIRQNEFNCTTCLDKYILLNRMLEKNNIKHIALYEKKTKDSVIERRVLNHWLKKRKINSETMIIDNLFSDNNIKSNTICFNENGEFICYDINVNVEKLMKIIKKIEEM